MVRERFIEWLEHLFDSHCDVCRQHKLDDAQCASCDVLRNELEIVRAEKDKLLDFILTKPKDEEPQVNIEELEPIKTMNWEPWDSRRRKLESESRKLKRESIDELEREHLHSEKIGDKNVQSKSDAS